MKRSSVYVAAGLFFAAAMIKLFLPDKPAETVPASYSAAVPAQAVVQQRSSGTESTVKREAVTVTINAAEFLKPDRYAALDTGLPAPVEKAVETFLDEQAPYEDLGIPANVSFDVPPVTFRYVRPVKAEISSPFGYRVHPMENLTKVHYGADMAALSGDDIGCFAAGTVTEVGENEADGRFIRVAHDDGFESLYAHCGTVYVSEGQHVQAGQKIALVGVSGRVTGPNLHFELKKDGVYLNPEFYFAAL